MKKLATYNHSQISDLSLKDITSFSNIIAKEIGAKETKRFSTKPKAVEKYLAHAKAYKKLAAEADEVAKSTPPAKPVKTSKRIEGCLITTDSKTKEGSIIEAIYKAINDEMCCTVQEVIDNVVANYERPRSDQPVTDSFVYSTITWCINNGKLNVSK